MKKVFCMVVLTLICLTSCFPIKSSSQTNNPTNNNLYSRLYISGQYKTSISHFSNFSAKETYVKTVELFGLKQDANNIDTDIKTHSNFNIPYSVTFQNNAVSFSGAIGYLPTAGPRVEVEGSYEVFDVKHEDQHKDAFRYFALARSSNNNTSPDSDKYVVMKNDGLSITSIIINGCYDFALGNVKITPHICTGFGGDFIEFFNVVSFKFAYQSKLGINYSLSSNIVLFADAYYHKVIGNKFKNLNILYTKCTESLATATATLNLAIFGSNLGLKFIF